jgi:hypothetical protein
MAKKKNATRAAKRAARRALRDSAATILSATAQFASAQPSPEGLTVHAVVLRPKRTKYDGLRGYPREGGWASIAIQEILWKNPSAAQNVSKLTRDVNEWLADHPVFPTAGIGKTGKLGKLRKVDKISRRTVERELKALRP